MIFTSHNVSNTKPCEISELMIYLSQEPEKIIVAAKKDMQTHLNVVPILVCEGPNFTTNELSGLVNIHLETTTATPYFPQHCPL
jgi:hypothetical protein